MHYAACALSDVGLVRSNNEDCTHIQTLAPDCVLALLADGMGGHNAGEVASQLAIEHLRQTLPQWVAQCATPPSAASVCQALSASLQQTNQAIWAHAQAHPACKDMGTTIVLALFHGNQLFVGHLGDSRCYRLRGGQLQALTSDHTALQEQLNHGWLTPEQACNAPSRHLLTRALGTPGAVESDVAVHQVQPDDCYLLCSDGLSDMLQDQHIAHILDTTPDCAGQAQQLIQAANSAGGRDNVSVVLVRAYDQEPNA